MGTRLDISWVAMSSDFYVEFRSVIHGFHAEVFVLLCLVSY